MTNRVSLRIHPAIGIARVGTSREYYLGPETMAAAPGEGVLTGGLPIKPGTDSTTITSRDLRDSEGKLKRQAARFRIYQYQDGDTYTYPSAAAEEVVIGSVVDGKKVKDIVWTVHLANKKANSWEHEGGIDRYQAGSTPPLRNPHFPPSPDPGDISRIRKLVFDAGPRAMQATNNTNTCLAFDYATVASYWNSNTGKIEEQPDYPKSFPASDGGNGSYSPSSVAIDDLGQILTEKNGRLIVLGAFGKACGFDNEGHPDPTAELTNDVDNNNWFDDTADGPVTAVLIFQDGSVQEIEGSAWVVTTDPAYAPQTPNVVTLWDNVYTTWLEKMALDAGIYSAGKYQSGFAPAFSTDVFPMLNAAHMQMWNTSLPERAINAHKKVFALTEKAPDFPILTFIRDPDKPEQSEVGAPLMPLSLGDFAKSFLTVTSTQYFFLGQWVAGKCVNASPVTLSPGEALDKAILVNCLGGRFSPGIDLTFIVTDPNFYNRNWKDPAIGAFRVNAKKLDYTRVSRDTPVLGVGYTPFRTHPVEPGDLCKFMSIPWHTDYNSCATHTPAPNPGGDITRENVYSGNVNTSMFWSWPAQRPVSVYAYHDLVSNGGALPRQRYSVRGKGTEAIRKNGKDFDADAMNVGRYQNREDMLTNWDRIGIVLQGPAIDGYDGSYDKSFYLEVESLFEKDDSNLVVPWPNTVTDKVYRPQD